MGRQYSRGHPRAHRQAPAAAGAAPTVRRKKYIKFFLKKEKTVEIFAKTGHNNE
jgi:hypothetical protein